MSFEVFENLLQVAVLGAASLTAVVVAFRNRERESAILALAYGTFAMGTLFYVLYLAIVGHVPQVFYVSEVSWLASYLFYLSLQIVRSEQMKIGFSYPAAGGAVATIAAVMFFRIFGPSYLMMALLALVTGALVYLTVVRLEDRAKRRRTDWLMLLCVGLQILLYAVSIVTTDYSGFNLYFAIDILLTASFVTLLPLTIREVRER
jgi:hypothetical protein